MSAMLFLVVLCLVLGYILYDSSKRNRKAPLQSPQSSVFKKPNSYVAECQLLAAMVRERNQQNNKKSLPKVSMHLASVEESPDQVLEAVKLLSASMDLYLIVNSEEPNNSLLEGLGQIVSSSKVFRCRTYEGEIALIRQLGSRLHIETDINVIRSLKAYLHHIVTVRSTIEADPTLLNSATNITSFGSLSQAFTNLDKLKL